MSEAPGKIVVAIPTYKRPQALARLLQALEGLDTEQDVVVVVADNDADGRAGYDLCRALCAPYRWPLEPVIAEARGIAQVRNVLVERALSYPEARFVAMLDDDEWPSPMWLDALLQVQAATGADIVAGSIMFDTAGQHAPSFDGVSNIRCPTGPVTMLEGAGNLLITRQCLERHSAPWFDPSFALSGGEDRDFFERVKAGGGRFAWSDEALAYTAVPEHRQSLGWLLRRAYGIGNAEMRIFLKYRPSFGAKSRECAKIVSALVLTPLFGILFALAPHRAADAWRRFFRNVGKLAAIFGIRYEAYAHAG